MPMNPYLIFNGTGAEAFNFYARCLGGKIEFMMTHGESPAAGSVSKEWQDKVMHARMTAGGFILMGTDAPPEPYRRPQGFSVHISTKDPAEAERIFQALAQGGKVQMPRQETFWAVRFGMVRDRFGTPWMINCEKER